MAAIVTANNKKYWVDMASNPTALRCPGTMEKLTRSNLEDWVSSSPTDCDLALRTSEFCSSQAPKAITGQLCPFTIDLKGLPWGSSKSAKLNVTFRWLKSLGNEKDVGSVYQGEKHPVG